MPTWVSREDLERLLAERGESIEDYNRRLDRFAAAMADYYAERVKLYGGNQGHAEAALISTLRGTGAPVADASDFAAAVVSLYEARRVRQAGNDD